MAIAIRPLIERISSSAPIIIPPDSSPPNIIRGLTPRLISSPKTSLMITSFSGFSEICFSTFFIIPAISLKPTGTLTTLMPSFAAHSSHAIEEAVVLIINLG